MTAYHLALLGLALVGLGCSKTMPPVGRCGLDVDCDGPGPSSGGGGGASSSSSSSSSASTSSGGSDSSSSSGGDGSLSCGGTPGGDLGSYGYYTDSNIWQNPVDLDGCIVCQAKLPAPIIPTRAWNSCGEGCIEAPTVVGGE